MIVSVAHLDDDERALVLGVLLEEVLSSVRSLSGSQSLRALIVFDEVYGFLPPHRALGNAGLWCIGRLQTDADRDRVLDGLSTAGVQSTSALANIVKKLNDRWFIMRDAHAKHGPVLLQPRWT
ncbi:MAG TPA: hypothetical protein VF331_12320, partial [Polyangiales bacterium]